MGKTLGLDLGTNSIGWAVTDNEGKTIVGAGARIIPMDAGEISDFESGNPISKTAERTRYRGMRRLRERFLLRRERLLRVLGTMGFLPPHYEEQLDRYGHWDTGAEPKLAWREGKDGKKEFLFKPSFEEMVAEFRAAGHAGKIPYDWTVYYLRKKALSQPIAKEELSWVLMQFNQKRGYYQLRGKDEEAMGDTGDKSKEQEYIELDIVSVEDSGERDKKGKTWYNITLENGWVYRRASATPLLQWEGQTRGFIATYKLDKEGKRKEGQPSLSAPQPDDWGLRKIKTEQDIEHSGLTVGEYIYERLLHHGGEKIIGGSLQTIDRRHYRDELHRIVETQQAFIPELRDASLYRQCIGELYPANDAYRNSIAKRDFAYLLVDDILFYQRPLKTKRYLIGDCPYEKREGRPVKCIAKSHPLFQEFRLWQFLSDLRIYEEDTDVTSRMLPDEKAWSELYDGLARQKSIDQEGLLKLLGIGKKETGRYRWNYVTEKGKTYPAGETRAILLGGLEKAGIGASFLNAEKELALWHLLYSVDSQREYEKALRTFGHKQEWDERQVETFAEAFRKLTVCKEKEYGRYSAKAISRLLPLMRRGKYWDAGQIDADTRLRIEHLATGEADDSLDDATRERLGAITSVDQCRGLQVWQACYLVYGRHSEATDAARWDEPEDINRWLADFRHNSLNNPVVEQVVTEAMRTVRDIWKQYGRPDEIHIELGRELKKTKAERERMTRAIAEGEATNQRIRLLLAELANPDCGVEGVRPHSPSQHELLKLYEEGAMLNNNGMPEEIEKIYHTLGDNRKQASHAEVLRYKLWLDQRYISPYTGRPIPLARLFTTDYQIEHIIPQSRYFDDSLSNKVICESEVNNYKDRELGHEFIANHGGETVQMSGGRTVRILTLGEYEQLVKNIFPATHPKRKKLMLDEIPEEFINRQLNDSRYISRMMMHLMSNIVREVDEKGTVEQSVTSKNVIPCNGSITDRLKRDWGLGDVWNRIILPRFERLNQMTGTTEYTTYNSEGHPIPNMPLSKRQGFNKKRIDHRHHALDAIVIACTTRDHVNLLNNEAAKSENRANRYALQHKLRHYEVYIDNKGQQRERAAEFIKPWPTFTEDTYNTLAGIIVSFKQNLRVINKTSNHYTAFANGKKTTVIQSKGDSWAIRKALHKETVYGEVNLQLKKRVSIAEAIKNPDRIVNRELKAKVKEKLLMHYTSKQMKEFFEKHMDVWSEAKDGKIEIYYYTAETNNRYFATRKDLGSLFDKKNSVEDAEKAIASITDTGIQKILLAHLAAEGRDVAEAFSAEGLERMNANLKALNDGKNHLPIKKVRVFEQANKFAVGTQGIKPQKYVEAAKGTNLYFVIFRDKKGKRGYATIPLNIIVELQKQYESQWQLHIAERLQKSDIQLMSAGDEVLYIMSPGDLVYVPTEEEQRNGIGSIDNKRIYKMVSCGQLQFMCIQHHVASSIINKVEFTTSNKMERALTGEMIKEICIPIKTDRLGNLIKIG